MSDNKQSDMFGFKPVGELLPKKLKKRAKAKPLSRVKKRGIEASIAIAMDQPDQIGYQHTVLCQTSMPYRDPGKAMRVWERKQGIVSLRVEAGAARRLLGRTNLYIPIVFTASYQPKTMDNHENPGTHELATLATRRPLTWPLTH